ncbi:hypothetical protein MUP77_08900, partial [Candidatus Bathyarchaeota archaeon]|nr:hypothetical protein [Candidatus Bathyarchaeota archaeon]
FTYIQEKSRTTPYLYALGEKGSGKSRVLEIIELLGYRPMMATSISGPNVIQYLEDGPLTILDDEVKESIENDPDKKTIYLAGYRNTAKVPKIITDRNGIRTQVFFNAFSFKAFSSRDLCDALLERSIIIPMVKGKPKYGGFTTDGTDDSRFQNLRQDLLLWRMFNHETQLSQERPKGRLDELYFPLIKTAELIGNTAAKEAILRIQQKEELDKLEEMRAKIEAKILIAIVKINRTRADAKKDPLVMPFSEIWTTLCKVVNGAIRDSKIECGYGIITQNKVSRRLKDIFKGVKQQIDFEDKYQTVYTFDKDILNKTVDVYGIQAEECRP